MVLKYKHVPQGFTHVQNFSHQMFVDGEDGDLQDGHDKELHRAGFTKNSSKGDEDRGCAEVSVDDSVFTLKN